MRKVLILLLLLAAAAGATFYVYSKKNPEVSSIITNTISSGAQVVNPLQSQPPQEVLSLREDTIAFVKIDLPQTARLADRINKYAEYVSGAPLWKRLGLSDRIAQTFDQGVSEHAIDPEKAPQQAREAIQKALNILSEITNVVLAIVPAEGEIPARVFLEVDVTGKQLQDLIEPKLVSDEHAEVQKDATGYAIKLIDPKVNFIPARIEFSPSAAKAYFNATGYQDFTGAKTLKDSNQIEVIKRGNLAENFFIGYVNMQQIVRLILIAIEKPQKALGNENSQEFLQVKAVIEQQWKGIKALAFSLAFHKGIEWRQCLDVEDTFWLAQMYTALDQHRAVKRTSHQFGGMLAADTIFGAWVDARGTQQVIQAYLDSVGSTFNILAENQNATDPVTRDVKGELSKMIKTIKEFFALFHPDELGVLVRPSVGLPYPDFLLYYSDEQQSSAQILTQIKQFTDKLAPPQPDLPHLEIVGEGTSMQLKFVGAPVPMPFAIAAVGERGVAFASGLGVLQMARSKVGQIDSFSSELSVQVGDQQLKALESDYFVLMNSRRAFDLVRPFMPMLVAQAVQAGQPVSIEEATDMMQRLENQFLAVHQIRKDSEGRYCVEGAVEVSAAH